MADCTIYPTAVNALSPIAYLRMDEPTYSTTHVDSTGNGHDASYSSSYATSVKGGPQCGCNAGALFQQYSPTEMAIPVSTFGPGSTYSVVTWVRLTPGSGVHRLLGYQDGVLQHTYGVLITIYGVAYFYSGSAVDADAMSGGGSIDDDRWHMIAYSRQNGSPATQRLWVDGTYVGSRSEVSAPPSTTATAWGVGQQLGYDVYCWASLDEVAVFDYVLSNTEVSDLWAAGQPAGPCPEGGWRVGRIAW